MNYAQAANDVYKSNVKERPSINGFLVDVDLSDERHTVYANPHSGQSHLSIRGTQMELGNLYADLRIMTGGLSTTQRYAQANNKLKEMRHKYGNDSTMSGHSLGAQISVMLSEQHGIETHAYNPGATGQQTFRNFFCEKSNDEKCVNRKTHVNLYTVETDPISTAYHITNGAGVHSHTQIKPKQGQFLAAHSMSNFL